MKSIVGLIFAVALVEFASAVTKEYQAKAMAAKDKCAEQHKIESSDIEEYMKKMKLPETEKGKCFLTCYMEEMKLVVDGKVNVDEWKNSNKEKWDDQEHVKKADEIAQKCTDEVSPGENKCEFGYKLAECGLTHAKNEGLPAPNFEHSKRR